MYVYMYVYVCMYVFMCIIIVMYLYGFCVYSIVLLQYICLYDMHAVVIFVLWLLLVYMYV